MSVIFTETKNGEKFSYTASGITYIMSHPNPTSEHILSNGIFEKPLIDWSIQNFQNKEKVFVDIGAHMGTYSFHLAPYFSHTHAFEAQKKTYYALVGGILLSNLINKVTPHKCALTNPDQAGHKISLRIISEDGGGSSIKNLENNQHPIGTEEVEAKTLDEFQIENIGFIKIDVEGAELDVLKGSIKTLEKNNYPPILFETWPDSWFEKEKEDVMHWLESLGYKIHKVYSNNMYLAAK